VVSTGSAMAEQPLPIPKQMLEQAKRMDLFLEAYLECGIISDACKAVVVGGQVLERGRPSQWARDHPEFRERYIAAREEVNDKIEKEVYRRAIVGWEEPVYQGGKKVGTIHKYDSTLLIFLAKANMPEKYRDKFEGANIGLGPTLNLNFAGDGVIRAIASLEPEELERLAARGRPLEGEFKEIKEPVGD